MRRGVSIVLLLFFTLGPLTVALQADEDARLPACCRRHGAHHCAMSDAMSAKMEASAPGQPIISAPSHCPYYPQGGCATLSPIYALAPVPNSLPALLTQDHSPVAARAAARMSQLRTRADRGPPASILA